MARLVRAKPGSPTWKALAEAKCVAKRQFMTRAAAEKFVATRAACCPDDPRYVYECPFCSLFHTTKLPP
jgi:hypothetical protein